MTYRTSDLWYTSLMDALWPATNLEFVTDENPVLFLLDFVNITFESDHYDLCCLHVEYIVVGIPSFSLIRRIPWKLIYRDRVKNVGTSGCSRAWSRCTMKKGNLDIGPQADRSFYFLIVNRLTLPHYPEWNDYNFFSNH